MIFCIAADGFGGLGLTSTDVASIQAMDELDVAKRESWEISWKMLSSPQLDQH
jgi:hypothetical protein